jgi:hypothetical protein
MIAKITQMIVTVGKSANRVTMPTITAPIVAPTSGIRSRKKTISASGAANGTSSSWRTM